MLIWDETIQPQDVNHDGYHILLDGAFGTVRLYVVSLPTGITVPGLEVLHPGPPQAESALQQCVTAHLISS